VISISTSLVALVAAVLLGGVAGASAQDFPVRPVRILTTEPGAASDVAARLIAQGLTGRMGQQVIVENRGGVIAIETLIKASPDGYTLLYYGSGLWLAPLMQRTLYNPLTDLAPVTIATNAPAVLVVHPAVAAKSVKELIALAKARPGELNYGSGGPGSTPHLAAELFKSMAGVNIVRVAFKGTGPAVTSVIGGEIQVIFATTATVGPHVKSGKLRALGVTSARPSALVPDLPTVASVLPGYELIQIQGIFAPAKTPATLVKRFYQEIAGVLAQADVKERFATLGTEAVGSTPEALSQAMRSEMARLGKVIKDAGIRLD
jgi:tripartite-type tricarboxylate transporter receptor subunit TctC